MAQSGGVLNSGERHVGQCGTLDRGRSGAGAGGFRSAEEHAICRDARRLSFRVEAFNIFNRTQAGNPGTTLTSPATFGIVTTGLNRTIGTGTSRQMQLAMRFNF